MPDPKAPIDVRLIDANGDATDAHVSRIVIDFPDGLKLELARWSGDPACISLATGAGLVDETGDPQSSSRLVISPGAANHVRVHVVPY